MFIISNGCFKFMILPDTFFYGFLFIVTLDIIDSFHKYCRAVVFYDSSIIIEVYYDGYSPALPVSSFWDRM